MMMRTGAHWQRRLLRSAAVRRPAQQRMKQDHSRSLGLLQANARAFSSAADPTTQPTGAGRTRSYAGGIAIID